MSSSDQLPSKEKMVEVPMSLIKRCFGFVNGYFQMDPGSAESNELWRDLNRENTRPRASQPPDPARRVACETEDGLLSIHRADEDCDVCRGNGA